MAIMLPLEKRLEDGFTAIGRKFSPRKYGEEVVAQAEKDGEESGISVKNYEKIGERKENLAEELLHLMGAPAVLSPDQHAVYIENIPFFQRHTPGTTQPRLIYNVDAKPQLSEYAPFADDLIRQGQVYVETISLQYDAGNEVIEIANVDIVHEETGTECHVETYLTEEPSLENENLERDLVALKHMVLVREYSEGGLKEKIDTIHALSGLVDNDEMYSAVAEAIMAFFPESH